MTRIDMQSNKFLSIHQTDYNLNTNLKKKKKYLLSTNISRYHNLENASNIKYYNKKDSFKVLLLVGLIILISVYSLKYYSLYLMFKVINYIARKINPYAYLVRKGMIYLSILLIIEILIINLLLTLLTLFKNTGMIYAK